MDDLTKEEKKLELRRIEHSNRRRQEKIENYGKMSPELRRELNARKGRLRKFTEWLKHISEPEKPIETPKLLSDAEILKRNLLLKLLKEDNPEPEMGINLWEDKPKKETE